MFKAMVYLKCCVRTATTTTHFRLAKLLRKQQLRHLERQPFCQTQQPTATTSYDNRINQPYTTIRDNESDEWTCLPSSNCSSACSQQCLLSSHSYSSTGCAAVSFTTSDGCDFRLTRCSDRNPPPPHIPTSQPSPTNLDHHSNTRSAESVVFDGSQPGADLDWTTCRRVDIWPTEGALDCESLAV